jgi:putative sterol carrier protein
VPDCTLTSREEAEKASFVIVATYARWKEVIRKQLDPTKGMMQNKLKLTKGHMPTMVKFVTANEGARRVDDASADAVRRRVMRDET